MVVGRRLSWGEARVALGAIARGASIDEAALEAGISPRSVDNLIAREDRVVLRERVVRVGVLRLEDREEIRVGIEQGRSTAVIAGRLGFARSTIGREIDRNGGRRAYRAYRAQVGADERARRAKLR